MNLLTCRRLLQPNNASQVAPLSPTAAASPHLVTNSSSSAAAASDAAAAADAYRRQLDSSIALTIVVLLTAFFFLGLLSFYIRRSSAEPGPSQEGGAEAATSLPLVAYTKQQMMEECPICLSEFEEGETVKLIPYCGHVFHTKCVDTWLQLHVTCPVCRSDQLFKKS